jgi:hypothetical protein
MARAPAERHPPRRLAAVRWAAGIGPVTAEAVAEHEGASTLSARALLCAAERRGLLSQSRPLAGRPALFSVTRRGLRACGLGGLDPPRVTAASASHAIACAAVAAALGARYPDHRVVGEPALRALGRRGTPPLVCARLAPGAGRDAALHRPDLLLWPLAPEQSRPVAVEVELTAKAPRRLLAICRGWARCAGVQGVLYLAAPEVERPLRRAVERACATERVAVLPLAAIASAATAASQAPTRIVCRPQAGPIARAIPGAA